MNKRVKWGIIIVIGAGLIGGGIYSQLPKENEELAAADKVMTGQRSGKKILNVNAKIIKPQLLKDEIQISGSLLPDEEVDLSFETSGKIIEINDNDENIIVRMDDESIVSYSYEDIEQVELAYAITVHKSQGSEYPVVLIPVFDFIPNLTDRQIIYTAITRA